MDSTWIGPKINCPNSNRCTINARSTTIVNLWAPLAGGFSNAHAAILDQEFHFECASPFPRLLGDNFVRSARDSGKNPLCAPLERTVALSLGVLHFQTIRIMLAQNINAIRVSCVDDQRLFFYLHNPHQSGYFDFNNRLWYVCMLSWSGIE